MNKNNSTKSYISSLVKMGTPMNPIMAAVINQLMKKDFYFPNF
jgi:hypothetical protein